MAYTTDMGFELVEHTGDLAVRLRGPDLPSLIESGVRALRSLLFEGEPRPDAAREECEVCAGGVDAEDLLVQSLSEALHLMQDRDLFPEEVRVELPEAGRSVLSIVGVHTDAEHLRRVDEIKAVTYHGVDIRERDGEVETLVVFDV